MSRVTLALIALIVIAATPSSALAGEIYGTITEGGKSVGAGVALSVKCGAGSYNGATNSAGGYQIVVNETGKCTLTVSYKQQAPSIEIASYDDGVQVDLVLELKDGKYTLRRK